MLVAPNVFRGKASTALCADNVSRNKFGMTVFAVSKDPNDSR
jgi:hypothetical protein